MGRNTMSRCQFCQREFSNTQGVKAHLRRCPVYAKSRTSTSSQSRAIEFNKSKRLYPHVQEAPDVMASSNPFTRYLDQLTQQFASTNETARVKQKREVLLADLCACLVDWYHPLEGMITPEMAAAAKVAILDELATFAIEDMPPSELTVRGTVIRNRIFAPYFQQQKDETDRQLTQHKTEQRRSQQDTVRHARRTTRKAVLVELGVSRALKTGSSRGLPTSALPLLEWEVRGRLETLLIGHETSGQVNETIEAAIERPLWEWTTRIEQLQLAKRERVLDECLALAVPVAEATWPWVKDILIKQCCETFGIQPSPDTHTNEERAAPETSSAPPNAEQLTGRPVRRRRVRPSGPTVHPDDMAGPSEPVEPPLPERQRAAS
jgi:hypothetical protein